MNTSTTIADRIGALSGLAFVGFAFAAFASSGSSNPPSPDEPSARLATYLTDPAVHSELMTTLLLMSVFCLFPFVACLARHIQQAENPGGWLAFVALGGGFVFAALMLVVTAVTIATNVVSDFGNDTQVAKTLYVIGWDFAFVLGPPLAAMIGTASLASVLHGALPRWIGWAGLPVTLLLVIPQLVWGGFVLAFPWLALASVALLWRSVRLERTRLALQGA
jgi:hypothetical protein